MVQASRGPEGFWYLGHSSVATCLGRWRLAVGALPEWDALKVTSRETSPALGTSGHGPPSAPHPELWGSRKPRSWGAVILGSTRS